MNCDYTNPGGSPLERLAKQQAGNHPAPCARSCEANAYQIEVRRYQAEVEQFRADARRFRLAEKNLFDVQEAAKIIAKQAIAAEAERDALAAKLKDAEHDRDEFRRVMNGFAEKMAELEGQEPVAWVEVVSTHEGPYNFEGMALLGKGTHLLYARPVPAELSPDFTDTARAALLWVLWHHQGGSSPVGQPIRYALGMDAHERLSEHQVQEAKRWAALTKSESTDFRQARTAPAEPVNVDFGKRGENMFFKIDNQSFLLEYKPEEQDEFDFMKAMLLSAFSRITHGVKTEIQPVNTRLLEALKRAKDSLVDFKFVPEHANCWEASDEENLTAVNSAIAAAEPAPKEPVAEPVNARLFDVATGKTPHLYEGRCPDYVNGPESRDPDCPACQAIVSADAQQERLLQDMHDAGREIDRVMAEATPKAARLTDEDIASLLAASDKNSPRVPSFFMTEPHKFARAIETAAIRKNGLAMED